MMVEDKKIGVGPSGWGRPLMSGLALPPWCRGWQLCVVVIIIIKDNHKMTIFSGCGGKKKTGGPSGLKLALRVGVGPSFLGFWVGCPLSSGRGWPFPLLVGVGSSFSGLELVLPVGFALPSLAVGRSALSVGVGHSSLGSRLGWPSPLLGRGWPQGWRFSGEGCPFLFEFGIGASCWGWPFPLLGGGWPSPLFGSGLVVTSWGWGWPFPLLGWGWPFLLLGGGWPSPLGVGVGSSLSGLGLALPVGLALPSFVFRLALPSLGWGGFANFLLGVEVGPVGLALPSCPSGLALPSWGPDWPAVCGFNFNYKHSRIRTLKSEGRGKEFVIVIFKI